MASKHSHPFIDYAPGDLPFYRASVESADDFVTMVGVVPGCVGQDFVLFMPDGTYVLLEPHALFPVREADLHQWVDHEWLASTKALKSRALDKAFRVQASIAREELEILLGRIHFVLRNRTFGLGELKLEIQTNDKSPYECEFTLGPFGLVLTDTPAGMSWLVVHHPDAETEEVMAAYPWAGHWNAAMAFFKQVGHYAIHRAVEEYGNDVMQAEVDFSDPTIFVQIPKKEV